MMWNGITTVLAALVAVVAACAGTAGPAHAADDPDALITWSAKPASEDGQDRRERIELDVNPGDRVEEHLAVTNFSETTVTFGLSAADGYLTTTGRFTMLPASEPSVGAGSWIEVQESVAVAPGATAVVPFAISVPRNATPGDHAAGVAASIYSSAADEVGTQVGIESRVGVRVMLRVLGELAPAFHVEPGSAAYDISWNPFRAGSVTVSFDLINTGNTLLRLSASADASGRFGVGIPSERAEVELLPGEVRHVERTVRDVWPLGLTSVDVGAVDTESLGTAAASVQRRIWVWAAPLPQLAFLAGATLVIASLMWRRRRHAAEIERLIDEARQQTERDIRAELGSSQTRGPSSD